MKVFIGLILLFTPVAVYVWSIWLGIDLFLLPLIKMYGFWNWLGMLVGLSAMSFASSTAFFYLWLKPGPRASYKESTSA